jgi:hypothetical protein
MNAPLPDEPVDPPVKLQKWIELHVDAEVFRLIQPVNPAELEARLAAAIVDRTVVRVRAYTDLNGETTVLVNPSRAAVVYLAKRAVLVPRSGMPD